MLISRTYIHEIVIDAEIGDERGLDIREVSFFVFDTRSGIFDAVVIEHAREAEQIVFVRMLVEVPVGKGSGVHHSKRP